MFRVDKIIKPWKDAGSLNANVNLYGFWNETTFLTKSGDLGIILKVCGVDFESLDQAGQEFSVRRLEAALKSFGPGFHIYQYLFKTNRPDMPFAKYGEPLIDAAIEQRREFFESKRDKLYSIEIFYAIVLEGSRSKTGVGAALGRIPSDPSGAWRELKAQFTGDNMKVLLRTQIERDLDRLQQRVGGNNPAETTGKFVAAKFEHDTARPVDGYAAPQLHTHAVIFNITERADGSSRALQERGFFDTQQFATAVYQAELTFQLRNLGYQRACPAWSRELSM